MIISHWKIGGIALLSSVSLAPASLISHYALSSDVLDDSGNANHGLFEGAGGANTSATFVADSMFGTVMDFDGTDDRISLGPLMTLQNNSWSVSLWVNTPADANRVPLWGKNNGDAGFSAGERDIEITGNGTWGNIITPEPAGNLALNGHSMGGVVTNQSAISLDDGSWHMVTVVHDNSISATHHDLYIDGALQTNGPQTMNNNSQADVGTMFIGFANASGSGAVGYFFGQMAEINFYDSAIDQSTVDALYAVPEASELSLFALGMLGLMRRRRSRSR